jgi:hypothetical protein
MKLIAVDATGWRRPVCDPADEWTSDGHDHFTMGRADGEAMR